MSTQNKSDKKEIFETMPVMQALFTMAVPTIISQLITLVYNITDTWFIGRTNNPYMVAAASMTTTIFLVLQAVAVMFGTGGGNRTVSLLGQKQYDEAAKTASLTLVMAFGAALIFSFVCRAVMSPLLYFLGASERTYHYAEQYLLIVVIIGAAPTVLSSTMAFMLRNIGHSKEASFGLTSGGVLNMILDPLFMFVILPDGYQVAGAALATLISNIWSVLFFIHTYLKIKDKSVLDIPRRIERVTPESLRVIFEVGIPAGCGLLFFDLTNMMLNRLYASYGDFTLAASGIVLKVERLSLNIGIGICLAMTPLIAYNYASGNKKRMNDFFYTARIAGMLIALICVVFYRLFAPYIIRAFIQNPETVAVGTEILKVRCFAPPLMFMCFHMVYFMQAIQYGKTAFLLIFIRQICFNIPMLFLLNHLFGLTGVMWSQIIADTLTVLASYLVYFLLRKDFR